MNKLLLLTLTIIATKIYPQYYVSKGGDDTNTGTYNSPFKTIQKAASIMQAGDVCYIMSGVYRETVIPTNIGNASSPITFKNYASDIVIVYGADSATNWTLYKNGIYKTYSPDSVTQLFVNNNLAYEARYPNFNGNYLNTNSWADVNVNATGDATFSGMNFPSNYWVGGYCVNLVGKKWIAHDGIIDNSSGGSVHCTQRSIPWLSTSGTTYLGAGKGFITHHINALDAPNEWYWQNDTLYYYPPTSSTISNLKIEARTRAFGFDCNNKKGISIIGINFIGASINFENAEYCELKKCNVLYPTPYFYYTQSWDRQYPGINNDISAWTGKGVSISGSNNTIKQCYIAHSWGDGISIGGNDNKVDSCLVEDCNWSATDDAPLAMVGRGHIITHNTMRHAARGILIHRKTGKATISYNNLYDCGIVNDDLGVTYSYQTNGDSTVISYNWVHDNHAPGTVPGIYLDNFDTAYIVHHNVIWGCYGAMRTNLAAVNHKIYNNTMWGSTWSIMTSTNSVMVNQIVKNNLSNKTFFSNTYTTQSNNLVNTSPGFTNLPAYDFTLTSTSPAIDYGVHIPGITDGYIGNAPDAGAYEYGQTPWVPGTNVNSVTVNSLINNITTSNNNYSNLGKAYIYPNPASDFINIYIEKEMGIEVAVYTMQGQQVLLQKNETKINTSSFAKGIYFISVKNNTGEILINEPFILQ